jgi:hypothetical protein
MVNQAGKQMNDAGRGEFFAGKSFSMEEGIIKSAYFLEFPSITTLNYQSQAVAWIFQL